MKEIVFLICFSGVFSLFAQPAASTNPPSIKWSHIKNEHVDVLFPKGLKAEASRIASIVTYLAENTQASLGDRAYPVTILFHGKSMFPNGFVTTSPFRSEIFGTPIQDWSILGPSDWIDLLAVHEYRHVLQFSNLDKGVVKLMRLLSGNVGWNLTSSFLIPNWYWEGDATLTETLQTNAGRGRNPTLSELQRAFLLGGKKYNYAVSRNDSYTKLLPSHYPLGYTLSLYAREKYGNAIWSKIIHDAVWIKRPFYSFNGAVKRNTGLSIKKMYKASYAELKENALKYNSSVGAKEDSYLVEPNKKRVANYTYTRVSEQGRVFSIYSAFNEIPKLVEILPDGSKKRLATIGITNNRFLGLGKNKILWCENQANPRWANEDYSRVIIYDVEQNISQILANRGKYLFATIDKKDEQLAFISLDENQNYLLKLRKLSESVVQVIPNKENYALAYPDFDTNGDLYFWIKKNNQVAIAVLQNGQDNMERVSDWYEFMAAELSVGSTHLYFRAGAEANANIYAISKSGGVLKRVTNVPVGASMPAVNKEETKLYYSSLSKTGEYLAVLDLMPSNFEPIKVLKPVENPIWRANELEEAKDILQNVPAVQLEEKDYRGFLKGLRPHSWITSGTPDGFTSLSSFKSSLIMEDFLETHYISPSLGFNFNEASINYGLDYSYGKYAVLLNAGYSFAQRNVAENRSFVENNLKVGLSYPLEWITGPFIWNSSTNIGYDYIRFVNTRAEGKSSPNPTTQVAEFNTTLNLRRQRAYQNLQTAFGIDAEVFWAQNIAGAEASLFRTKGALYLPGIMRNHGTQLSFGFQVENYRNAYQFIDQFDYPRGFNIADVSNVNRMALDYKLPLVYPDLGFFGITYFKRIRANLFYDFGVLSSGEVSVNTASAGVEIRFDNRFFNFIEIPVGVRLGYRTVNPFNQGNNPLPNTFINLVIGN